MVSPLSKGSDPYILPPGSWQGAHFAASTGLTVAAKASVAGPAPGAFASAAGTSFGGSPEGGLPGGYGAIRVKRAGETEFRTFQEVYGTVSASKFTNIVLREGDEVMLDAPGGGGFGDPLERDRDAVARDLEEGIVSAGAARELYGWAAR